MIFLPLNFVEDDVFFFSAFYSFHSFSLISEREINKVSFMLIF